MQPRLLSLLQQRPLPVSYQHKQPQGHCQRQGRRGWRRCTIAAVGGEPVAAVAASGSVLTVEEVQRIAAARGVCLSVKTLGPFYRVTCREGSESGKILGVTSGFVVPLLGLMHCDTLQIFTKELGGDDGDRVRGGVLGLGLLMGAGVFAHAAACGCRKAEILAINDDDSTHARLVRYYRYFGFQPVLEVSGGRLADLPHMLVWGGAGTRMDADVEAMLGKWAAAVRGSEARGRRERGAGASAGAEAPPAPRPAADAAGLDAR